MLWEDGWCQDDNGFAIRLYHLEGAAAGVESASDLQ